jgi:hypothetical protein
MLTVEKEFVEFKDFEGVTVERCLACEAVVNRGTS